MTMNDFERDPHDPRDAELAARLEAYARDRLTPDPAARGRLRAALIVRANEVLGPSRAPFGRPGVFGRLRWRVAPAFVAAAFAVVLLAGGALAASHAGGPLYGARLWLEDVTLPSDPDARLNAETAHLQARLDEAAAAGAAGDAGALSAALDAYGRTFETAVSTTGADTDRANRLGWVIGRQRDVLSGLVERLPAGAGDAMQRTLQRTQDRLHLVENGGNPGGNPGGPPTAPGPGKGGGPGNTPDPNGPGKTPAPKGPAGPQPNASPHGGGPDKSPKP
jgi:hypothetical protein